MAVNRIELIGRKQPHFEAVLRRAVAVQSHRRHRLESLSVPAARRERATNDSISVMADTGRVQVLRAF